MLQMKDLAALCTGLCFFFQAEDGIRDADVTGVQTCALPILQTVLFQYYGVSFTIKTHFTIKILCIMLTIMRCFKLNFYSLNQPCCLANFFKKKTPTSKHCVDHKKVIGVIRTNGVKLQNSLPGL